MTLLPEVNEEFNIDFENELSICHFIPMGFYKIAESSIKPEEYLINNPDANPIEYTPVSGLEEKYKDYYELVYLMVVNDKVAKIGGTYTGMRNRLASYSAGSLKNRNRGTCSTTNFKITQVQYAAIRNGKRVEWYVHDIPSLSVRLNVWGDSIEYNPKTYYKYESILCKRYEELMGHYPLLSTNVGVE